ncbi:23S rRNA (adenine(1618)-N(6))-methyltransferase RlmF [Lishizhenia sp.]|uniref:23S rRNA (adenine(1618)-N(6))-methyltransferase RlmF n=1 Tax=Lishizhenia sp. TaxID=2497594 RepID=UPI00299F328C|nr:23S rRNA (adenine(1618)-N(6))-methyltransferase RlmF [Lishizhenia sp.]MDX1445770.1 23S rRNA (adenine(1618)-N(6))-methyltransferase RlmF [Lishizhenia sp.]
MAKEKTARLHPNNKNNERYDLEALIKVLPELNAHIKPNKLGQKSIDFSNPKAVKLLNQALLKHYYGIQYWDFPDRNLCPPIPGRADYIHYLADLLKESNYGKLPDGDKVVVLDIGVGANCIYPLLGVSEYNWNFIGADISEHSLFSAQNIMDNNPEIAPKVNLVLQHNPKDIFYGIIDKNEHVDITMCNPPFHASAEDAKKGSERKVKNLGGKAQKDPLLNFAGISNELITEGGENKFLHKMIKESKKFGKTCFWFTSLVSKQSNLKGMYKALERFHATDIKTIEMGTGNKSTRIVAWTFLNKEEQQNWRVKRWK